MAISEDHDHLFDNVRGQLGEHFTNYMFVVIDDSGHMYYDYTNPRVGRMCIVEAAKDMNSNPCDIVIEWDDEEADLEEED